MFALSYYAPVTTIASGVVTRRARAHSIMFKNGGIRFAKFKKLHVCIPPTHLHGLTMHNAEKRFEQGFNRLVEDSLDLKPEAALKAFRLGQAEGESVPAWQTIQELIHDVGDLLQAPLVGHTQVRLLLLLYSHMISQHAPYHLLANLLNILDGSAYRSFPFGAEDLPAYMQSAPARQKANYTANLAKQLGYEDLAEGIRRSWMDDLIVNLRASSYSIKRDRICLHQYASSDQSDTIPLAQLVKQLEWATSFLLYLVDRAQQVLVDRTSVSPIPTASNKVLGQQ